MGLMDRIKKVTGTNDSYDDSYDDDYYQGFDNEYDEGVEEDVQVAGGSMGTAQQMGGQQMGGMGAQMNGGGSIGFSGSNIKMQVVRPKTYDSETATQIANLLLNKCGVVLTLENTNKEASKRLIDFLTGVAYSIGGSLKKITITTYIVAPSTIDVDEAKLKPGTRRSEPQAEAKDSANEDFSDFN